MLPPELHLLMHAHLTKGRQLIISSLQQQGIEVEAAVAGHLYMWPSTGKPVIPQQVSQLFQELVCSSACKFGPQWCRSLFVGERRGSSRLEVGMSDEAAAVVMNNSLSVWASTYDKLKASRHAAEVQQGMQAWRVAMLGKADASELLLTGQQLLQQQQQQQQPAAQLGAAAAGAAAGVVAAGAGTVAAGAAAEVIVISDSCSEGGDLCGGTCSMSDDESSFLSGSSSASMSEGDMSLGDSSCSMSEGVTDDDDGDGDDDDDADDEA